MRLRRSTVEIDVRYVGELGIALGEAQSALRQIEREHARDFNCRRRQYWQAAPCPTCEALEAAGYAGQVQAVEPPTEAAVP